MVPCGNSGTYTIQPSSPRLPDFKALLRAGLNHQTNLIEIPPTLAHSMLGWTWMNPQFQKPLRFVGWVDFRAWVFRCRSTYHSDWGLIIVHWGWCCQIGLEKPVETFIVVLGSDQQWCVRNSGPDHTFCRPFPVPCTNELKSAGFFLWQYL